MLWFSLNNAVFRWFIEKDVIKTYMFSMIGEVAQILDSSILMLAKLIMQHLYFFMTLQENKFYLRKAPYGSIMSQPEVISPAEVYLIKPNTFQ